MPKEPNALEAFEGVPAVPAWLAGVVLAPDQQARACDLLRAVMLSVEEPVAYELALEIEEFLTEAKPLGSAVLQ